MLPTVTKLSETSTVVIWWYVSYRTAVFNGYLAYLKNGYDVSKYLHPVHITLCLGSQGSFRFLWPQALSLGRDVSCVMNKAPLHSPLWLLSWYLWKKQHSIWLIISGIYYLHRRFRNSTKSVHCSQFDIPNFKQSGEWNHYGKYMLKVINGNLLHLPNQSMPQFSNCVNQPSGSNSSPFEIFQRRSKLSNAMNISAGLWYSLFSFSPVKPVHETLTATALKQWKL